VTKLQAIRYTTWAAVAVILVIVAVLTWRRVDHPVQPPPAVATTVETDAAVTIGGPFTLVDDTGATITQADLAGHPSLLFFGFTHCPDVCPTALAEAGGWLSQLGSAAGNRLKVYFVTVDPERDTQAQLNLYLSAFDPRITGITGPTDAVHTMLDEFHVYYAKMPADESGNYDMQHTASFYLLDNTGTFVGAVGYDEDQDAVMQKLRSLVAG
jgi:protein SCO1/2